MLKTLIIVCAICCVLFLLLFGLIKPFRDLMISLFKKYKEIIVYGIVGGLTTVVAIVTLYLFHSVLNIRVEIANVISWLCAVIFSFVMNKIFVFEAKDTSIKVVLKEFGSFLAARIVTLFVDEGILIFGCNVLHMNAYVAKIISEVFVIIINYFFSKFVVFKKK